MSRSPIRLVLVAACLGTALDVVGQGTLASRFKDQEAQFDGKKTNLQWVTSSFHLAITDINKRALLDGVVESETFYPSLYLAYSNCVQAEASDDPSIVQEETLPATLSELARFRDLWQDTPALQRKPRVVDLRREISQCIGNVLVRLVRPFKPVKDGGTVTAAELTPTEKGQLAGLVFAPFWDQVESLRDFLELGGSVPTEKPDPEEYAARLREMNYVPPTPTPEPRVVAAVAAAAGEAIDGRTGDGTPLGCIASVTVMKRAGVGGNSLAVTVRGSGVERLKREGPVTMAVHMESLKLFSIALSDNTVYGSGDELGYDGKIKDTKMVPYLVPGTSRVEVRFALGEDQRVFKVVLK